jgi:hypothetical protein
VVKLLNHPYKLLVSDIDGTLVSGSGSVSALDREALARARNLGIQVSLSTGRGIKASLSIIDQLSLGSYHTFFDGALVSSPSQNEEAYVQPISPVTVSQMVELAHRHNLDLELYSASHYFAERETWSTNAHREFFGIEPTLVDFTKLWELERIIKGGLVTTNPQEADRAKEFCTLFDTRLHFSWARTPAYPGVTFINILAPEVSKGRALEALASHLGIAVTEVIAVGDGSNDISLLTAAGLAIAMADAPDEVKAVADYVTLDVDHSGLAAAIERFLL